MPDQQALARLSALSAREHDAEFGIPLAMWPDDDGRPIASFPNVPAKTSDELAQLARDVLAVNRTPIGSVHLSSAVAIAHVSGVQPRVDAAEADRQAALAGIAGADHPLADVLQNVDLYLGLAISLLGPAEDADAAKRRGLGQLITALGWVGFGMELLRQGRERR